MLGGRGRGSRGRRRGCESVGDFAAQGPGEKIEVTNWNMRYSPMLAWLLARDLSPNKQGPVLPWRGLVGTTRGLQFQFQGFLF